MPAHPWCFTIYRRRSRDPKSRYGWRLVAPNGRVVAASSEGFSTAAGAQRNARLMQRALTSAPGV